MKTEIKKPKVKLSGTNGNVFVLTGKCATALKDAGMETQSEEMCAKIFRSKSYDESIQIMMEYCDVK